MLDCKFKKRYSIYNLQFKICKECVDSEIEKLGDSNVIS